MSCISRAAEVEIVMVDLEKANQRATSAETRLESLQQQSSEQLASIAQEKVIE